MLGFIKRQPDRMAVNPELLIFVEHPRQRALMFGRAATRLDVFTRFLRVLQRHTSRRPTLALLGRELRTELGATWTDQTATVHAKILLDWARQTGRVPEVLRAKHQIGRDRTPNKGDHDEPTR